MAPKIQLSYGIIGGTDPFIVAEIGSNFGNYEQSVEMIDIAKRAGANAVKFQTYKAINITAPGALFNLEDGSSISQHEYFRRYELSEDLHFQLKEYCDNKEMIFFSTPSHIEDVELLNRVGVELYKTGSDDLTNIPLLKCVANKGKPIILSTGMSTLAPIEEAVEAIYSTGNREVVILHCVVGYPAPEHEANIYAIRTLRSAFDLHVGFSDHFRSTTPAVLAASLGASLFEKHLTLDRSIGGPDNDVALEPKEFADYVIEVRSVDQILGKTQKLITEGEVKWQNAARKSVKVTQSVKAGEVFTADNIAVLRPSGGIHPRYYESIIGKKSSRDIESYEAFDWEDIVG